MGDALVAKENRIASSTPATQVQEPSVSFTPSIKNVAIPKAYDEGPRSFNRETNRTDTFQVTTAQLASEGDKAVEEQTYIDECDKLTLVIWCSEWFSGNCLGSPKDKITQVDKETVSTEDSSYFTDSSSEPSMSMMNKTLIVEPVTDDISDISSHESISSDDSQAMSVDSQAMSVDSQEMSDCDRPSKVSLDVDVSIPTVTMKKLRTYGHIEATCSNSAVHSYSNVKKRSKCWRKVVLTQD